MANCVLFLYFREEDYGKRFLRFMMAKKHPGIHPELLTRREMLLQRAGMSEEPVFILTDDPGVQEDEEQNVILLAGEQDREKHKIFQYQSGEGIYQELLIQLGLEGMPQHSPVAEQKKGVIMLFSTEGSGVTVAAVMLSQFLGKQGRCLYLSLSAFPVFYNGELQREPPPCPAPGLGELLFYADNGLSGETIRQFVQRFGNADMLVPLCHFKDILDCSPEDWRRLFRSLCGEGGYDTVVVEVGQLFESVMEFLELGDYVWLLGRGGPLGKIRDEVFRRYCRFERKENLLDRAEWIRLPERWEEWEEQLCVQPLAEWGGNAQMMQEIQDLWEHGREGEENVYIWEDLG